MDFSFSKHAKERINTRGLNQKIIIEIIENPDVILQKSECKQIFQKVVEEQKTKYLYRIFINICKQPPLIITAYKTSKIDKYEH